jgi:hypothetical protein
MPNVIILSVVLLNVVAPTQQLFVALCPFIKLKLRGVVKNLQTLEHCRSADSDFLRAVRRLQFTRRNSKESPI